MMELSKEEYLSIKECIRNWIVEMNKEEKMPKDIQAINFGLFEPYGIEMIGSKQYDDEEDDWACEEDFVPKNRECPELKISEDFNWEYVLDIISQILKEIINDMKDLEILNVKHITTGFCDGDLLVIK